jgi:hypothetical protein
MTEKKTRQIPSGEGASLERSRSSKLFITQQPKLGPKDPCPEIKPAETDSREGVGFENTATPSQSPIRAPRAVSDDEAGLQNYP